MKEQMTATYFFEKYFSIHGEFNGVVHRTKRNGVVEKYPYEPVSHYKRTALTIRNEWIRKFAMQVSNPQYPDYQSVIKKLNYYTPYILAAGKQKFLAETVFFVRKKGEYEFIWQGSEMGSISNVCKRTSLSFSFHSEGDKLLNVYLNDELYCQRWFCITAENLDARYEEWLELHFAEVLAQPEPEYESLKTYRRGMKSKVNWLQSLEGKFIDEVHFTRPDFRYKDGYRQNPWMYHRKTYDHSSNPQTLAFDGAMPEIGADWQALSEEERDFWRKQANRLVRRRITGFNVFTSFRREN